MNDEESIDILIHSAEWYAKQSRQLLDEWKSCRTEHARQKLIPKLKHISSKLKFESSEIKKIMGEGEGWKDGI